MDIQERRVRDAEMMRVRRYLVNAKQRVSWWWGGVKKGEMRRRVSEAINKKEFTQPAAVTPNPVQNQGSGRKGRK